MSGGTNPERLRALLTGNSPKSARELSAELSLSEREVTAALEKLARSLARRPQPLGVLPARCIACGFEFAGRGRTSKPSRCPECRSERIQPARFWIAAEP